MVRSARAVVAAALAVAGALALQTSAVAQDEVIRNCTPEQLSPSAGQDAGDFNGMGHSGTLVRMRNLSARRCLFDPFAAITFQDTNGRTLRVVVQHATPFSGPSVNGKKMPMGHGPVVQRFEISQGWSTTAELRWVSTPVYTHSVCLDVARVSFALEGGAAHARLDARICGPDANHVTVTATRFISVI
jgi:hypothetical protein